MPKTKILILMVLMRIRKILSKNLVFALIFCHVCLFNNAISKGYIVLVSGVRSEE
jgi:hypothetical protein